MNPDKKPQVVDVVGESTPNQHKEKMNLRDVCNINLLDIQKIADQWSHQTLDEANNAWHLLRGEPLSSLRNLGSLIDRRMENIGDWNNEEVSRQYDTYLEISRKVGEILNYRNGLNHAITHLLAKFKKEKNGEEMWEKYREHYIKKVQETIQEYQGEINKFYRLAKRNGIDFE